MTPGGALRAREPTPGPGAGEEGAWRRRGAGGRRSRDAAERGRASGARGGAAPARETDSETLGRGGLRDRPAGSAAAEWPPGAPTPGRPARDGEMNGFSTEEDSREGPPAAPAAAPGYGQSCCLIEDGERCVRPAGNASFSKRVQKSISQKKLKLDIDKSVSPPAPAGSPRPRAPGGCPRTAGGTPGPPPALGLAALGPQTRSWTRGFQGRLGADLLPQDSAQMREVGLGGGSDGPSSRGRWTSFELVFLVPMSEQGAEGAVRWPTEEQVLGKWR